MRENYYKLLELDPSVKDEATINSAITKKQQEWSGLTIHPTKGRAAKQNLDQLQDIKKIMLNNESRNKEAEEAKKILGVVDKNKKDKVDDLIDKTIMKRIRSELDIVKKKDLFDFLSLQEISQSSDLMRKAKEIYNESSRNPNKTAEITAKMSLASLCETHLKDETSKQKYIKSLKLETGERPKEKKEETKKVKSEKKSTNKNDKDFFKEIKKVFQDWFHKKSIPWNEIIQFFIWISLGALLCFVYIYFFR